MKDTNVEVFSIIAGLGGRSITKPMLREYFSKKNCEKITFLGLKEEVIAREYKTMDHCDCKEGA
jgi:hypothetical protein